MPSITSANCIYMLRINALYDVAQQLQGFGPDEIFTTDQLDVAETEMGVDGVLSAGFIHAPVKQTITIAASSELTNDIFDNWWTSQQQFKDVYVASGLITLPSVNRKYTLNNGYLLNYMPLADAGKTLKPRKFAIIWESIYPSIIAGVA